MYIYICPRKTTSVLEHKNGWIFRMHINAPIKYVLGFDLIDKKVDE